MGTILSFASGVIMIILLHYLIKRHEKSALSKRTWTIVISGAIFIIFGLAWGITSFAEREPQAGYLGIAIFSGFGIVLLAIANRELSNSDSKMVPSKGSLSAKKIVAAVLIIISALTLPFTFFTNILSDSVLDSKLIVSTIDKNVLSDKALPVIIKKRTMYQNAYDSDTILLADRMILNVVSGVEADNWIQLFDKIMPENERLQLAQKSVNSINSWLESGEDYPEFTLETKKYLSRVETNTQFLAEWVFHSFTLPPSTQAQIDAYKQGQFPTEFDKYMEGGIPPAELMDKIIPPASEALKASLLSADIPQYISLSETIAQSISPKELKNKKAQMLSSLSVLKYLWVFPILILIIALGLVVRSPKQFLKWIQWPLLLSGTIGVLLVYKLDHSIEIINSIIPSMATLVPAPALSVIYFVVPAFLKQIGSAMYASMLVVLVAGIVICLGTNLPKMINVIKKQVVNNK